MKILLLEDMPTDKQLIEGVLNEDFEIEWHPNSPSAIKAVEASKFDFYMIDVRLERHEEDRKDEFAGINTAKKINEIAEAPTMILTHEDTAKCYEYANRVLGVTRVNFVSKQALLKNPQLVVDGIQDIIDNYYAFRVPKGASRRKFILKPIQEELAGNSNYLFIDPENVAYITSETPGTRFHFINEVKGKSSYSVNKSFKKVTAKFNQAYPDFIKITKYCINPKVVDSMTNTFIRLTYTDRKLEISNIGTVLAKLKLQHLYIDTTI